MLARVHQIVIEPGASQHLAPQWSHLHEIRSGARDAGDSHDRASCALCTVESSRTARASFLGSWRTRCRIGTPWGVRGEPRRTLPTRYHKASLLVGLVVAVGQVLVLERQDDGPVGVTHSQAEGIVPPWLASIGELPFGRGARLVVVAAGAFAPIGVEGGGRP